MSAGHRRGGGCGSADSFHLDPGVLLREWHQHPAGEQHAASGRNPGWSEAWRGAHGPALRPCYCKCPYSRLFTIGLLYIAHSLLTVNTAALPSLLQQHRFQYWRHCHTFKELGCAIRRFRSVCTFINPQMVTALSLLLQNPQSSSWKDPALSKVNRFCSDCRCLDQWVPVINLPDRWNLLEYESILCIGGKVTSQGLC